MSTVFLQFNSMNSRGQIYQLITMQTVHRVVIDLVQHTQPSHPTSMVQMYKKLIRTNPGHTMHNALRKLKMATSSWTSHKRMVQNLKHKSVTTTKQHGSVIKTLLTNLKTQILSETQDLMSLKGEHVINPRTGEITVWRRHAYWNSRQGLHLAQNQTRSFQIRN